MSRKPESLQSHPDREPNLIGKLPQAEADLLHAVLLEAGSDIENWHPDDRKNFDPKNPLAGLCDLASSLLALIYADTKAGDHVEWLRVQKLRRSGWKSADYDVHYDLSTQKYGILDLTREQFERGRIFKKVGPKKINPDTKAVNFSRAQMGKRLSRVFGILQRRALEKISEPSTATWTPELLNFLAQLI